MSIEPKTRHNLPSQPTSFIGREDEIAEIVALLDNPACRLLTLVGPGGSGKTRLALEVVRHTLDTFTDGAYFIPLQPLDSPNEIIGAIINTLSLRFYEDEDLGSQLIRYFRDRQLLLIMDNFEHLTDGADILTDILREAPLVKIVVTSREALKLQEEWVRGVNGLDYPKDARDASNIEYSALQLFTERAQRLMADFSLEREFDHVRSICQLVEGLPLALELAAGWLRILTCQHIAVEIKRDLDFLAANIRNLPQRHRSMRVVFDHSWHLLNEEERAVVSRFVVFREGCTHEAAEAVAGASLPLLAGLVEKSLLRHDPHTGRYDMQELLRQYAEERLRHSGEWDGAHNTHCNYYAHLLHDLERHEQGHTSEYIMDVATADFGNIQAAWMWAVEHRHYDLLDGMADFIWEYAASRAACLKAMDLYEAARIQLIDNPTEKTTVFLGRMLGYLGMCHGGILRWRQSINLCKEGLAIARQQDNPAQIGSLVWWVALALWHQDQPNEAIQVLSEFATSYREVSPPGVYGLILKELGDYLGGIGQIDSSRSLHQESMVQLRASGDNRYTGDLYLSLGLWDLHAGQWNQAEAYLTECRRLFLECQHVKGIISQQARQVQVAIARGQVAEAQSIAEAVLLQTKQHELLLLIKNQALALSSLSVLADMCGDLDMASRYGDEALILAERAGDPFVIIPAKFAVGWNLISQGDGAQALDYLMEFLETALLWKATGNMLYGIGAMARILALNGKCAQVAELMGLVFSHSNSPIGFFQNYLPFAQLRADLETELGTTAYQAAWERGQALDPEQVVRELLTQFTGTPMAHVHTVNGALPDPLTERELDVLRLMSAGLSNLQIAEQLVVATGTVKAHTNHIFSKLGVNNRVQAVNRAKELHLF
jgi:predicted ATPase/DNA-binding CsgD family transcriptional regulator/tetratricopeptide (TPR) repeat protein